MQRCMLKSKLHRLTVTDANVDYEGSITVDAGLLEAADILPYEQVHVWNVTRGTRFVTYAMPGEPGSGTVCINGAGARLTGPGDIVIVATFQYVDDTPARSHQPRIILIGEGNRIRTRSSRRSAGPH
jgi:aspartate 1-decarboxylase